MGDSRVLSLLSRGMWGICSGFVLIWVHFGTLERTQLLTGICGIRFIVIQINTSINRSFPSSLVALFQSESKCETILMKMNYDLHENETACRTHFNMKGFALRLVLKQRHKRTRK